MSASTRALDRPLHEWLSIISTGRLVLPSFQRRESWDRNRVSSMLGTIVRNLPLGVVLVLEVGDEEKFLSRPLTTAPDCSSKPSEHLLDGQQRLTALWRALNDNYETETYFVHVPILDEDPGNDDVAMAVWWYGRWMKGDRRMPLWIDDPAECLKRGLIPMRLLRPDADAEMNKWVESATGRFAPTASITNTEELRAAYENHNRIRDHLKGEVIAELRETVRYYNLPYLSLPASTDKLVALDVFINMNTNSKPLSTFDVIVAEVESETEERLQELLQALATEHPILQRYGKLDDLVLQTSALLQDKAPNARGELDMDKTEMIRRWSALSDGLARAATFLESEGVMDEKRLPTAVSLPVIAALYTLVPADGDELARGERIIRAYVWSSFFTSRYENAAASRAHADHRGLVDILTEAVTGIRNAEKRAAPIMDRDLYPLPGANELRNADWPKSKRVLARAVLAASTYFGARDFADDNEITPTNVKKREYHHLFPDKLLSDSGIQSFRALNCALITWKTNRVIGRMDPIAYLEERSKRHGGRADEISRRLATHLVPFDALAIAGPYPAVTGNELRALVERDYERFLARRGELIASFAESLCNGERPTLTEVLQSNIPELLTQEAAS
jgi:hypothetical protein